MDTSAFGWPISAPIKRVGSKLYVEARETLSPYGYFYAKQCKKGAYKQLEDFLKQFGLKESDTYLDKNSRSFISAEAFILTLIAPQPISVPSGRTMAMNCGAVELTGVGTCGGVDAGSDGVMTRGAAGLFRLTTGVNTGGGSTSRKATVS